ncbi:MAG: aldehyde dehydrogenase EutE [Myxococcales bacterium]|nr:aldehyde dehydrogenase EutE [Myxococcales bacterium]
MDDVRIEAIVAEVVRRLGTPAGAQAPLIHTPRHAAGRRGLFNEIDDAVAAAGDAYAQLATTPAHIRQRAIDNMRRVTLDNVEEMAKRAVEETGLGRIEDKINKNRLVANKTPGMEILQPSCHTGDNGLTLDERGSLGVIGSITPCTNATETILNNAISMIAGSNTVAFNVHPSAKRTLAWYVKMLNEACVSAGAPDNMMTMITEPTIKSAQALMTHQGVRLLAVTGGGPVVKAALNSGKRAVCAGPGNPPTVVDETANIRNAARDIVAGASLDNNIVCIVEKEIIVVESVADRLKQEMSSSGGYEVKGRELANLEKLLIVDGHMNRKYVGKNASVILGDIGVKVPDSMRIVFAEVHEDHPFVQLEMLSPVLGLVRVPDWEQAVAMAVRVEHGNFHTATMHSMAIDRLDYMARAVNCSIFVKNAPSYAGLGLGGEGYTAWTIAGTTGEGLTNALTWTKQRRCTLRGFFHIV